jgi:hypothetical protein
MYLKSKNQRRSDGQKDLHGFRNNLNRRCSNEKKCSKTAAWSETRLKL